MNNVRQADRIASQFDDRTGYQLVDYVEVGLPVMRLTATALMQIQKKYAPIEEFVLRSMNLEFTSPVEISSFLGLSPTVVESTLSNLIRSGEVYEKPDHKVILTPKGVTAAYEGAKLQPSDATIAFDYDGLTRKPNWYATDELFTPDEIFKKGWVQIRAFPAKRPEPEELNINDVYEVLKRAAAAREESRQLLRLKDIRKARRFFRPAIMLIYKASVGNEVQVAFVVDGRISEEHEMAFLRAKGPEKHKIVSSILDNPNSVEYRTTVGPALSSTIEAEIARTHDRATDLKRKVAVDMFKAQVALEREVVATSDKEREQADEIERLAKQRIAETENEIARLTVRTVAVYEHPKILRDAIASARTRLLIISPWITHAVVDDVFIAGLEALLARGVHLYIGYGINDGEESKWHRGQIDIEGRLRALAKRYKKFIFVKMGDTHAKVLLKDSEYFVVTSFNWLSFRGDPKRTYREEWGTYVGIEANVDEYFGTLVQRFESTVNTEI